jgi:predicted extracellular nuclease
MATALTPGDIAILGFRSGTPDGVAFVTFKDLDAGTMLGFTDASYQQPNTPGSWRGSENFAVWTATSTVPAGTVVVLSFPNTPPSTADAGTVSSAGLNGISGSGDQIFVYQRSDGMVSASSPFATTGAQTTWNAANAGSLLFGINVASTGGFITSGTTNLNSTNTSYLPDAGSGAGGLTLGATALNITSASIIANAQYSGARTGLSIAALKTQILDQNNWSAVDATTGTLNSTDLATNDIIIGSAPTIVENTTTPLLNLAATGSGLASGVISDPTDPAKTLGIDFLLADTDTPVGNLTVTVASSNQSVVANANLTLTGTGANRNLKINPTGVGLSDITVTVNDGTATNAYIVKYAASAASLNPTTSRFLTGASNASTAIAIDSNYMLVGDDENQALRLYDRTNSGLAVNSFDYTSLLGLTDISGGVPREVDIEASAKVGNRIFWLGSQSNNDPAGNSRPNRDRLFATDITGTGAGTSLNYVGRYDFLRQDIINWDVTNGHGKGANFYGLAASAAAGVSSKANNGYNIEGLEFAPNNTTAYVAFRAPQEPTGTRTNALIVPVTNLTTLLAASGGGTAGTATFGAPIELDLGGRGIREIRKNASNQYVIIAGPAGDATGVAPADFRLYTWTGTAADVPVLRSTDLSGLNVGGSFESIVEVPANLSDTSQLQLLVDNGETVFYNDGAIAKDVAANFQKSRSELVTLGNTPLRIHDLQGAAQISPFNGRAVTNIPGIVTAIKSNGFYFQDPNPDNDDRTSEAIFVFTSTAPTVAIGDAILVNGNVAEFRPAANVTNLTTTQISSPTVTKLSSGNPLPTAIILGNGGRTIPTTVIDNDTTANIETGTTTFDPAQDGIDFYESLEGMRVQINNPIAVSPTNNFGEIWVLADNGTNATGRTARGGIGVSAGDFNPERIQIDDTLFTTGSSPLVNVGATFDTITGIVDYSFNNFEILPTALTVRNPGTLAKEVTTLTRNATNLTVGTFNVQNLDPSDGVAQFNNLANRIVTNLGSPDILAIEEIQDNNGATNTGIVDATITYQTLINAIVTAGGPTYQYRQIDPVNNQDGGEPGGNIRQGFLFDPTRTSFVDIPGGGSLVNTTVTNVNGTPTLSASPGRLDPTNTAFNSSRKPLVGQFTFNGQTVFIVANHFNSKGGDDPLYGPTQPPILRSQTQRQQQANIVAGFASSILAIDPNANVIVAGDLNDFEFSNPLTTLKNAGLNNLLETLPQNERYTYNFQGNAQAIDHIFASNNLLGKLNGFDVVHINSEFATQDSDHDPSLARFNLVNTINGTANADNLVGTSGNDLIFGFAGNDTINGGAGNDTIFGGAGVDLLFGGAGNDVFGFNNATEGIDKINDFEVGIDLLSISRAGFGGNTTFGTDALGVLDATRFGIGSSASTADQRFVYNNASGALFFDADGVGGTAQVRIAQLVGNPALTNTSFVVV